MYPRGRVHQGLPSRLEVPAQRPPWRSPIGVLALLVLLGCDTPAAGVQTLTVFAASSLTEAFEGLERGFERSHPEVDVRLVLAGSQVLRMQLEQGARADVFASADEGHMRALVEAGHVLGGSTFAHNSLALIVPPDNPAAIERFAQLDRAQRLVLGSPSVPVGRYAREALGRAQAHLGADFVMRVTSRIASEEPNERLVRAKVELGEADAALVYRTDGLASKRVKLIAIPPALNVRASYPIGVLAASARPGLADGFLAFVHSAEGQRILTRHGFLVGPP